MTLRNIGKGSSTVAGVDLGGSAATAVAAAAGGGVIPPGSASNIELIVGGLVVADEPALEVQADSTLSVQGIDDPQQGRAVLLLSATGGTAEAGADDLGDGLATAAGDALSATVWTPVNLDRDYVVGSSEPVKAGDQLLCELDALVDAGTGIVYLDVMSVNSGRFAGGDGGAVSGGSSGVGWPTWQCPATVITAKSVTARITLEDDDIDPSTGTATIRVMYRLSAAGGGPVILGNDTDGHYRFQVINRGPVVVSAGQNTGPPTNTPPAAGTVTDRLTTDNATGTTLASGTFNATTGHVLVAIVQVWLSNVAPGAVSFSITDNIGDTGGTPWTLRRSDSGATGTGSGTTQIWTRTVGTTPGTGKAVTLTHNAAANRNASLTVLDLNGWVEAPVQVGGQTTGNVPAVTLPLTQPGTGGVGTVNDLVITTLMNLSSAVPVAAAPTIPTTGTGPWVAPDDTIRNDDGHATAYQIAGVASSLNWTGLSPTAGQPIPASFAVFTPSGSSTAAPGVETWDSAADTSANVNGDLGWVIFTPSY